MFQIDWFIYIVVATIFYGLSNFVYKIAAESGCSGTKLINKASITVAIFAISYLIIIRSSFYNVYWLLLFAFLNSSLFATGAVSKVNSLRYIPTSYYFPISKLNTILIITLSIIFFHERPLWNQWLGILIALSMIPVINMDIKSKKSHVTLEDAKKGIMFALLTATCLGFSIFVGKIASTRVPKLNFIFISYSFVALYTFFIDKKFNKNKKYRASTKKTYLYGIIIGILNFWGYYFALNAFAIGPLSLIQGIFTTSMIIPIILSVIFLKEPFNIRKGAIVLMALTAVMLIKWH